MRMPFACFVALGVAACAPPVPESGQGVGFQDYSTYMQQREAALQNGTPMGAAPSVAPMNATPMGTTPVMQAPIGTLPGAVAPMSGAPIAQTTPEFSTARLGAAIDAADGGVAGAPLAGTEALGGVQQGVVIPDTAGDIGLGATGEPMAAPVAALPMEPIQPAIAQPLQPGPVQPLPTRTSDGTPNIVQFALSTSHAVGTPMYERSSLHVGNLESTCAKYGSADVAQEAFLAAGGPDKDRKGIDPDGDGYACSWDPQPFRAALN